MSVVVAACSNMLEYYSIVLFVYSRIQYFIIAWGCAAKNYSGKAKNKIKQLLRLVTRLPLQQHCEKSQFSTVRRFTSLNWRIKLITTKCLNHI